MDTQYPSRRDLLRLLSSALVVSGITLPGTALAKKKAKVDSPLTLLASPLHSYKSRLKKVIKDPDRKKAALAHLERYQSEFKALGAVLQDFWNDLVGAAETEGYTRNIEPDLQEFRRQVGVHFHNLADLGYTMRSHVTEEEWHAIYAPPKQKKEKGGEA